MENRSCTRIVTNAAAMAKRLNAYSPIRVRRRNRRLAAASSSGVALCGCARVDRLLELRVAAGVAATAMLVVACELAIIAAILVVFAHQAMTGRMRAFADLR